MPNIEVELRELADRFPSKESWHNHQITLGFYLPSLKCYKWAWGLQ